MAKIDIVPVHGFARFLTFCKLPRLLYKDMPGFAPCLDAERWTLYGHRLNPHFKRVTAKEFLARRDGRWVGRIAAQVYKPEIEPVGASRAQFGSLDAIDDIEVVRALTGAAEAWLMEQGASRINGPFSPSVNGECGLLVDGFDAQPMFLMPWHPPYLSRLIEALGYEKARDLISYRFDISKLDFKSTRRILDRPEWRARVKIRPLDMERLKQGETALMAELFNDSWRDNWAFVPFGQDEFDSMADGLKYVVPPEAGGVAEMDGKAQAFFVALPNLHEVAADLDGRLFPFGLFKLIRRIRSHNFESARMVLLGMRKSLQKSASGGALLLAMIEELRARGDKRPIGRLEAGWVLEDNMGMRRPIELFGGKVDKVHRVYEKRLANGGGVISADRAKHEAGP